MQVDAYPQSLLIDVEERPQPRTEEPDHRGSLFAKLTSPSPFDPSPAYRATPAARKAASSSSPILRIPSSSHAAISPKRRSCCGFGVAAVLFGGETV